MLACCLIKTESIKSQNHRFCLEVFLKNKRKGVFCCGVCKDNDVVWIISKGIEFLLPYFF